MNKIRTKEIDFNYYSSWIHNNTVTLHPWQEEVLDKLQSNPVGIEIPRGNWAWRTFFKAYLSVHYPELLDKYIQYLKSK